MDMGDPSARAHTYTDTRECSWGRNYRKMIVTGKISARGLPLFTPKNVYSRNTMHVLSVNRLLLIYQKHEQIFLGSRPNSEISVSLRGAPAFVCPKNV